MPDERPGIPPYRQRLTAADLSPLESVAAEQRRLEVERAARPALHSEIYAMLGDAAKIRALITQRPKRKDKTRNRHEILMRRAHALRDVLSGLSLETVFSADARNSVEHFDERIDGLVPREDRLRDRRVFEYMTADRLRTAIAKACTATGVPAFSPHDLRHRRVSLLHLGGMPWARIGELVGHDDLMTTAKTYTHVVADEAELDYEALLEAPSGRLSAANEYRTR